MILVHPAILHAAFCVTDLPDTKKLFYFANQYYSEYTFNSTRKQNITKRTLSRTQNTCKFVTHEVPSILMYPTKAFDKISPQRYSTPIQILHTTSRNTTLSISLKLLNFESCVFGRTMDHLTRANDGGIKYKTACRWKHQHSCWPLDLIVMEKSKIYWILVRPFWMLGWKIHWMGLQRKIVGSAVCRALRGGGRVLSVLEIVVIKLSVGGWGV